MTAPATFKNHPLPYHNGHVYVKWIKNAIRKIGKFLNIYRRKAISRKKETGFKNGRLLGIEFNEKRGVISTPQFGYLLQA